VLLNLTAAVRRGAPNGFIMADLPYACAREGLARTVEWTKRFYAEPPTDAVKIEATDADAPLVEALANAGVPVVAHLGLLPQSIEPATGYRGQGKTAEAAAALIESARRMENAGATMLLLEAVASEVAREITRQTPLPVIGCVAGPHCDGTVVVLHDMIGLGGGHPPRAVKQYLDLSSILAGAFQEYVADIHEGRFPSEDDSIHMKPGEYAKLMAHCRGA
jgi:3-methyl-2-oxobutanoate hydroxymethyltransferase